jgi:hypothetical protein
MTFSKDLTGGFLAFYVCGKRIAGPRFGPLSETIPDISLIDFRVQKSRRP